MYEAWFWFKNKLMMVPNHKIFGRNLVENFYHALNTISRAMEDAITGGSFMNLHWEAAADILDRISLTNRGGLLERKREMPTLMLFVLIMSLNWLII